MQKSAKNAKWENARKVSDLLRGKSGGGSLGGLEEAHGLGELRGEKLPSEPSVTPPIPPPSVLLIEWRWGEVRVWKNRLTIFPTRSCHLTRLVGRDHLAKTIRGAHWMAVVGWGRKISGLGKIRFSGSGFLQSSCCKALPPNITNLLLITGGGGLTLKIAQKHCSLVDRCQKKIIFFRHLARHTFIVVFGHIRKIQNIDYKWRGGFNGKPPPSGHLTAPLPPGAVFSLFFPDPRVASKWGLLMNRCPAENLKKLLINGNWLQVSISFKWGRVGS